MRCHQFRTNRHRDSASQRTAHDTARDHTHRVTRRERDSAFGDKAQAQHQRRFAALLLAFVEFTTRHQGSDTHRQRRNHTGRHDRRHRRIDLRTQQPHAKRIRRFVHRAAHIGTHHGTEDSAQQDGVRRTHALQPCGQARQDFGNRRTDHVNHRQTHNQAGEQRNDKDWLQRLHTLRQLHFTADGFRHVTGQETRDDAADKAGTGADREHTADKTRRKARTVGDGERDITGQYRHHQGEC